MLCTFVEVFFFFDDSPVLKTKIISIVDECSYTKLCNLFSVSIQQDDLMMLIDAEDAASPVHKMLISLNKPKVSIIDIIYIFNFGYSQLLNMYIKI